MEAAIEGIKNHVCGAKAFLQTGSSKPGVVLEHLDGVLKSVKVLEGSVEDNDRKFRAKCLEIKEVRVLLKKEREAKQEVRTRVIDNEIGHLVLVDEM